MKRLSLPAAAFAAVALLASAAGAQAPAAPTTAQMAAAATQIQKGCVERGEEATVCACGVGLAYGKLEPGVFLLIPKIEPLLDEKDALKAISALTKAITEAGLTVDQGQRAYEAIRTNRKTVKDICKPLAALPATARATVTR